MFCRGIELCHLFRGIYISNSYKVFNDKYYFFFKPNEENLYHALSWKKYNTILVIISTPPIVSPITQLPVKTPDNITVSMVPTMRQVIVFNKCLL